MMTDVVDDRGDLPGRWADIDGLLLRGGPVTGPGFEPGEDVKTVLHDMMHILVVGAGGLGCELLKDLGAPRGGSLASRIVPGRGLARVLSRRGASERAALASVLPRARLAPVSPSAAGQHMQSHATKEAHKDSQGKANVKYGRHDAGSQSQQSHLPVSVTTHVSAAAARCMYYRRGRKTC